MEIITEFENIRIQQNSVIAIGKFDGVHKGHLAIINELLRLKKERNLVTVIFSFSPSPADFFGLTDGMSIMSSQEKRMVLEELGIDYLIEFPFNKDTAAMDATDFIKEMLCNRLNAKYIVSGYDVSFGKGGAGNASLLNSLSKEYGYETMQIEKVRIKDTEISSSLIRKYISESDIEFANEFLGKPYMIQGQIITGNRIGRTIGFPTINIMPASNKVLPKNGVYYSRVLLDGVLYNSISNIGVKPTISDDNDVLIETYIYDFDMDVYGKDAVVYLIEFKRPEQKFSGISQLSETLKKDIADGKKFFEYTN